MSRRQNIIPLGSFARDSIIKNALLVSFLFTVIPVLTLIFTYRSLPPVTPLFYSVVHGQQQLADKQYLPILPITGAVFFISHFWLAKINFYTDRMFARLLSVTSTLVSFLFFVALIHIVIIVL